MDCESILGNEHAKIFIRDPCKFGRPELVRITPIDTNRLIHVFAYSDGIRTPIPIESGQESGRCRTALRSLPDRIPAASGQQSGTVRTEFRSDPDNVPGHPDSAGHRPEWGGGKGS